MGTRVFDRLTIIAGRRFGKAAHIDTPIPTPLGWRTMADVQDGDWVFGEDGVPVCVQAVTEPWFSDNCFEVTFSDHSAVVVDGDHEWMVHDKAYRKSLGRRLKTSTRHWVKPTTFPRVVTTSQMLDDGLTYRECESSFAVPVCGALAYPKQDLPIDPYVLGAWLGDGHSAGPAITTADQELLDECSRRGFSIRKYAGTAYTYGLGTKMLNPLGARLRQLGVLHNKHVPDIYKQASIQQRLDLIKGLMDTDGYCDEGGHAEFCNTNKRLADDVCELLQGLGEKPTITESVAKLYGREIGPKFRVHITPRQPIFHLPRKLARQHIPTRPWLTYRYITDIRPVEGRLVKCIQVDSPSSLYLFGRACIPTHNSRIGSISGAEEACVPNSIGWACAPTNPKLHRYVIPAFQQIIPDSAVESWSTEFNDLRLKNGALIHFQTLEDPDQGRGQGLDWLWIDEVCELTKAHWDIIRPSLAGDTVAFFTTSPRSYDWVYDDLYKPAEDGIPGYWSCHAKTSQSANPRISAEFLARERDQMSDAMYRQEYEADFVTFTGAVYGDLIVPQILRTADEIRRIIPEWPAIAPWRSCTVGIDTGADHPFGGVKLLSTEAGLVAVGEYLDRDKTFVDHTASLKRLASPHTTRWAINKNERQPMIELSQHGINCQPAENDQLAGIERVKTWLHNRQLWFIEALCPQTIRQMKALRWADPRRDGQSRGVAKVHKKDDELPDCIRYSVMTWPTLPTAVKPSTERNISHLPGDMQATIARMRRIDKDRQDEQVVAEDFWI